MADNATLERIGAEGIDATWLVDTLHELVDVDSPVGYYVDVEPMLAAKVAEWGYEMYWDRKHTGYVRVPGRDRSRCVCVASWCAASTTTARCASDSSAASTTIASRARAAACTAATGASSPAR